MDRALEREWMMAQCDVEFGCSSINNDERKRTTRRGGRAAAAAAATALSHSLTAVRHLTGTLGQRLASTTGNGCVQRPNAAMCTFRRSDPTVPWAV